MFAAKLAAACLFANPHFFNASFNLVGFPSFINGPGTLENLAAKEILRWRQTINEILSQHSGKSIEQLEKDSDRDYYMSAEEAKEYGLVDEVISKKPKE